MKELISYRDKRMTIKEVAEVTGAAYSTVAAYAQKAGWTENGKQTLLNENQVAVIVEAMKATGGQGQSATFQDNLEGIEATRSRAVRLAVLAEKRLELERQFNTELEAEINELKAKAEEDRPKVEFFNQVADSSEALQMRDAAAILNIPGWGRNTLFEFLRNKEVLDSRNIPYRKYQDQGYFRVIEQKYTRPDGETCINLKTLVYQTGVDFIRKLIQAAA